MNVTFSFEQLLVVIEVDEEKRKRIMEHFDHDGWIVVQKDKFEKLERLRNAIVGVIEEEFREYDWWRPA